MARLESSIERAIVKYAKSKGVLVRKLNGEGERGWPDRMFLYAGRVLFLELKQPGKQPTKLQAAKIRELRANGFWADWTDGVEEGRRKIDTLIQVG